MNKPLSAKTTLLIVLVLVVAAGGGMYYFWNFMGRQEGKSLGEVMKYYNKPEFQQKKPININPIPQQFRHEGGQQKPKAAESSSTTRSTATPSADKP